MSIFAESRFLTLKQSADEMEAVIRKRGKSYVLRCAVTQKEEAQERIEELHERLLDTNCFVAMQFWWKKI